MNEIIEKAPDRMNENQAPEVLRIKISSRKAANLIGPGGQKIRSIKEATKTKINVEQENPPATYSTVVVTPEKGSTNLNTVAEIITAFAKGPEVKRIYEAMIVGISPFGAFANIIVYKKGETKDLRFVKGNNYENDYDVVLCKGLIHRTEISDEIDDYDPEAFKNHVAVGDLVWVVVLDHDEAQDKSKLSMKCVNQTTGQLNKDVDLDTYGLNNSGGGGFKKRPAFKRGGFRMNSFGSDNRDSDNRGGGSDYNGGRRRGGSMRDGRDGGKFSSHKPSFDGGGRKRYNS